MRINIIYVNFNVQEMFRAADGLARRIILYANLHYVRARAQRVDPARKRRGGHGDAAVPQGWTIVTSICRSWSSPQLDKDAWITANYGWYVFVDEAPADTDAPAAAARAFGRPRPAAHGGLRPRHAERPPATNARRRHLAAPRRRPSLR